MLGKINILVLYLLLGVWSSSFCVNIDSLYVARQKANSVRERLELSLLITDENTVDSASKMLRLNREIFRDGNRASLINIAGKAARQIGVYHLQKGNIDSAEFYYKYSLESAIHIKDTTLIAQSHTGLGNICVERMDMSKALQHYIDAANNYEQVDDKSGLADIYNNIGIVHQMQNRIKDALVYYQKAKVMDELSNNLEGQCNAFFNIGNLLYAEGNFVMAIYNFEGALKIFDLLEDQQGISDALNNLAVCYEETGDLVKSIEYLLKAYKISEHLGSKYAMASLSNNIGSCYSEIGNHKKGLDYVNKGLNIARSIGAVETIEESYENLAAIYERLADYRSSLKFHKLFSDMQDSIIKHKNAENYALLKTKYETNTKQRQIDIMSKKQLKVDALIAEQQATLDRKKSEKYAWLFGVMLTVIFLAFILLNYWNKRKAHYEISAKNQEIKLKNKNINSSIRYAKRIQDSTLHDIHQLQHIIPSSFILYKPKDVVSGDFYWFEKIGNKLIVAAVDCTGHGVPGAFMSLIGNESLNDIILIQGILDPASILKKLHEVIVSTLNKVERNSSTVDGMDLGICTLDMNTKQLEFASCGRPLVLIRDGEMEVNKGGKFPIGLVTRKEREYETHTYKLKKTDQFYIFSDGYHDQFGGADDIKFGKYKMHESLLSINKLDMASQKKKLEIIFNEWKGDRDQLDDVCVIGIEVT